MHTLLTKHHLFLPATFAEFQKGAQQHTWQSDLLGKHRIDYVGLPVSPKPFVTESFVDAGIDISHNRDHFPVGVRFAIKQSYSSSMVVRRKA